MPWQLTTPVSTGDLDVVGSYTRIEFSRMVEEPLEPYISVRFQYGNTVLGAWVAGADPKDKVVEYGIVDAEYVTFKAILSNDGEGSLHAFYRSVFEHLESKNVIPAGTYMET